ncbi:MAG: hypothetical protein JO071_01650 [Deltaproteobacteria bacterium]|nr:hypothetical protein [Deltaproteobacteria bacterium]
MVLVREPEREEMEHISHRLPVAVVKRYRALVERGKKMRVNVPASYAEHFPLWLDEVETELNNMNVSRLRTTTKPDE